jgi:hypothetical protein
VARYETWMAGGAPAGPPQPVIDNHSRAYNKATDGPLDVLEWRWENQGRAYRGLPEPRYEHYKTWPELYSVFKHLFKATSFYADNKHESIARTIEVYTPRNGKFEDFEREVMLVLDRVEYKDDDGWRIFDVFDHYLSEGGNSVVLKEKDGKWKVEPQRSWYGGGGKPGTMKEAFEYLRQHRWYDNGPSRYDSDDEEDND